MGLQASLDEALREIVGTRARERGFRKTRRLWRKSNSHGDWAAFEVQSSQYGSAAMISCTVNLGAAPEPLLEFNRTRGLFATGNFAPSDGIYWDRLSATEGVGDRWWTITSASEAAEAVRDMAQQLEIEAWPLLDELLDRDRLAHRLRDRRMGAFSGDVWAST